MEVIQLHINTSKALIKTINRMTVLGPWSTVDKLFNKLLLKWGLNEAHRCYFSHILLCTWLIFSQCIGAVPFKPYWSWRWSKIYSSGFLLGFFGLRERLLALHSGQMGALRWICWWQDRQAWREEEISAELPHIMSFCCLVKLIKKLSPRKYSFSNLGWFLNTLYVFLVLWNYPSYSLMT